MLACHSNKKMSTTCETDLLKFDNLKLQKCNVPRKKQSDATLILTFQQHFTPIACFKMLRHAF